MGDVLTEELEGQLPTEAIRSLMDGVAPERTSEIAAIFEQLKPQFEISSRARGYGGFAALEQRNVVLIAPNTIDAVWFLSFAAWHAFRARIPEAVLGLRKGGTVDAEDPGYYDDMQASRGAAVLAKRLVREHPFPQTPWPDYVPHPQDVLAAQDRGDSGQSIEHVAVKDLSLFALSYILSHELRHLLFNSGREGVSPLDEELACDEFAVEMILGRANEWRPNDGSDVDSSKVLLKRSLGLFIGFFVLHAFTPDGHRGAQWNYPSLLARLKIIVNAITLPDDHDVWLVGITLLHELYGDPKAVPRASQSAASLKEEFVFLAERGFR